MVVVDKLTKAAHFVPIMMTHTTSNTAEIYMKEIARLHGTPKTIVSYRGLFQTFGEDYLKDLVQT